MGFSALVLSTLQDLRTGFENAVEEKEDIMVSRRVLKFPTKVNIVALANEDTRLLVGSENGTLSIYDTSALFTSGTNDIAPLKSIQIQDSALAQIVPNPSAEPSLRDLIAVVGDGKVVLYNTELESQGGWQASDLMTQPISG